MSEQPTLAEFAVEQSELNEQMEIAAPSTSTDTVTMTADEQVATYLIEDQIADLTDPIREAVQNGIDSPNSIRVLVSISPDHSIIVNDGAGRDLI